MQPLHDGLPQDQIASQPSEREPGELAFEIREQDGYAIGVAYHEIPVKGSRSLGTTTCQLQVKGPLDAVRHYVQEMRIPEMYVELDPPPTEPEAEWRGLEVDPATEGHDHNGEGAPNLDRDRLIEFSWEDSWDIKPPYKFVCRVDPEVRAGTCDIYKVAARVGATSSASATVIVNGGNPDLYLYHGTRLMARGQPHNGNPETVTAGGGADSWSLHVYGNTMAAKYEFAGVWKWNWVIESSNVPDDEPHPWS